MSDSQTPEKQTQDSRPKLRCPGCAFMVPLPAEICPSCGVNLRTGEKPEEEAPASASLKIWLGAAALVAIIGLAVIIFGGVFDKPEPVQKAAPPPSSTKSIDDLDEAMHIFQDLQDHNLGERPAVIIDRTKETADKWEEKRKNMDEVFQATE